MFAFIKLFFDICLFKKGPQDVPGSDTLFRLLILIHACISFLVMVISSGGSRATLQTVTELILILGLSWVIMFSSKKTERYPQTATALLATDSIISLLALPAILSIMGQGAEFAFIAVIFLMFWHWLVTGHIFSNALDQPFSFGLGIAFLYILTSYQVMGFLFPEIVITEQTQ